MRFSDEHKQFADAIARLLRARVRDARAARSR